MTFEYVDTENAIGLPQRLFTFENGYGASAVLVYKRFEGHHFWEVALTIDGRVASHVPGFEDVDVCDWDDDALDELVSHIAALPPRRT